MKFLLTLIVGAVLGYTLGFRDAQKNEKNIFERKTSRAVGRVGGSNRANMDRDLDSKVEKAIKQ